MLTADLVRARVRDGRLEPFFQWPTGAGMAVAEGLLAALRPLVNRTCDEVDEALEPVVHGARSLVLGRGLVKILFDGCTFTDPPDLTGRRRDVLLASARLLTEAPAASAAEHRQAVAATVGSDPDRLAANLYCDLPHLARLTTVPDWDARALLDRYNLGLAQACLLKAGQLEVLTADRDPGRLRRVLSALRFQRLLAEVRQEGEALRLRISGPASVLDQGTRYGLQLACFLPALAELRTWSAEAAVPWKGATARYHLDQASGLRGGTRSTAWVPDELRELQTKLADGCPDWRLDDTPALLTLDDGEVVVPDVAVTAAGRTWAVELFHRWHRAALERRLAQLARGAGPSLLLGVDRALAKAAGVAPLLEAPVFAQRGFLFSSFVSPRGLKEVVGRQG